MLDETETTSETNPELFHYTSVDAFRSIYDSKTFWATHYEDLNDSSELSRFGLRIRDFIAPTIRKKFKERTGRDVQFAARVNSSGGIDAVAGREAAMHSDLFHGATFGEKGLPDVFVCSFCTHDSGSYEAEHGLLSQWRGYGIGDGVALVLDKNGIAERMTHEKVVFSHRINHIKYVTYDDDPGLEKRKEFCKVFELLPKLLLAFYAGKQPSYEEILEPFIMGSTLVKHHAFHEEKEVRIVVSPKPTNPASAFFADKNNSKPVKYRQRGEGEVRYIELFGDAPLPIKRVIVGPSRIRNVNYQNVKEWTAGSAIEVVMSETPFVG